MSRLIATFGYFGLLRPAPGTWGSAAAVPVAVLLHWAGSVWALSAGIIVVFFIGWWATAVETRGKDNHDPSEIVIDEVAGQFIAIWPLSFAMWLVGTDDALIPWPPLLIAFLLFRLFDITKPGPVGWADRQHTPLGVMLDDVIAGLLAAIVLLAASLALPWLLDLREVLLWIY